MNICVYDLLSQKTINIVTLQKWLVWTLITNTLIVMDVISSSETLIALEFWLFFSTHNYVQQIEYDNNSIENKHIGKKKNQNYKWNVKGWFKDLTWFSQRFKAIVMVPQLETSSFTYVMNFFGQIIFFKQILGFHCKSITWCFKLDSNSSIIMYFKCQSTLIKFMQPMKRCHGPFSAKMSFWHPLEIKVEYCW
jgi:hypothetical protein